MIEQTPTFIRKTALPLSERLSGAEARREAPTGPEQSAHTLPRETPRDGAEGAHGPLSAQDGARARRYTLPAMNPAALREWRVAHNYTREELAAALDTTESTIKRWESGAREANWRLLQLALHGLSFVHGSLCRCGHPRCSYRPNRYASNGRAYDPH